MCFAPPRRAFFRHQLPKVLRGWSVLCNLTWKCALRHNSVQFFVSHLASWLRARRFSELAFRPSGATHHWKNTVFRDFPTFSRTWIFFLLRLSLFDLLSSSLLFSDSSHLCFSSVHIVGSLTSKLPSISIYMEYEMILGLHIGIPTHWAEHMEWSWEMTNQQNESKWWVCPNVAGNIRNGCFMLF